MKPLIIILLILLAVSCGADQIQLDIAKYFNNDGISANNAQEKGSLDKGGYSYPADEFPEERKLISNGINFDLPNPLAAKNNISCKGQEIILPEGRYEKIHLLASAVNGSYIDEMIVTQRNGESYNVDIAISDWCAKPKYNEITALIFNRRHGPSASKIKCYIWKQTVYLKKSRNSIKSIILPENPDLHIFAITAE